MVMDDKNLENINEIDLSIDPRFIDDDLSFGSINIVDKDSDIAVDDRPIQSKTGIIIDLSDSEEDSTPKRISAQLNKEGSIDIDNTFQSAFDLDSQSYNTIDMETDYIDDDMEDAVKEVVPAQKISVTKDVNPLFFENVDEKFDGEVSKDYWREVAKKHAKSNKKGAYNTHFHLSGNPKADREFFNAAMGAHSAEFSASEGGEVIGNVTGVAGDVSATGMGESLEASNHNYSEKLQEIFDIIGVDVIKNSDKSYSVIDLCDIESEYTCSDLAELTLTLQPYIEDCFIYPLQIATKLSFDSCKDWVNWYNSLDDKSKYAKLETDIDYCDVLANHLDECRIGEL